MRKKTKFIPVNPMAKEFDTGIAIGKTLSDSLQSLGRSDYSHRRDYHIFILAEKGSACIEIDFEKYIIKTPYVLYIHPNQVHRVVKNEKADFYIVGISNENLNPEYLKLLEHLIAVKPLRLKSDVFSIVHQSVSLCVNIFERKHDKLYPSSLKDCCNTLVALLVSQYLEQTTPTDRLSRFDFITKEFQILLERDFTSIKRPADYAAAMNISTPYLNECVRNATGFSVSHQIQQRIILEAKRLLYYSDKSVKEIANELGYDDYAYFSRFFTKVVGMTALTFRNKNIG